MAKYKQRVLERIHKRVISAMSGLGNISVKLKPDVCPNFNVDTKVITTYPVVPYARNDEEDFILGRGIVIHEAGHLLFAPNTKDLYDELKTELSDEELKDCWNWLNVFLDANNEFKVTELWSHLKEPLARNAETLFEVKPEKLKTDNPFIQVLLRCDKVATLKPEYPPKYQWKDFCERMVKAFNKQEIHRAKGSKVIEFTKWVNKEWIAEQKKKKAGKNTYSKKIEALCKSMGKAIKNGDQAVVDKTKEEIDKARKEMDASGGDIKDDIDNRKMRPIAPSHNDSDYSEKTLEELQEMLKEIPERSGSESTGTAWGNSEVDLNCDVKEQTIQELGRNWGEEYPFDTNVAYDNGIKINKMLKRKIALEETFCKRQRTGQLDMEEVENQVFRNGRIMNPQIFQNDVDYSRGGEWAVDILIDMSGSMGGGTKMSEAKLALATLARAFDGLPNIHYSITGYTDTQDDVIDIPIKRFRDKRANITKIMEISPISGNCDGVSIRASIKRLRRFSHMKRLMVVISDGEPAYRFGIDDTKSVVEEAERLNIKVIGIGIEGCTEQTIRHIYPTNYLFNKSENLADDITNLILSCLGQRDKARLVRNRWEI